MRKAQAAAGAQQHDLGLEPGDEREMFLRQRVEARHRPGLQSLGQHDDARLVARPVHHHIAFAVAGEGVQVGEGGGVEFHC